MLSHHLSTMTERNEHKLFEDFCRALAQREICPNLRPPTGPEGGGDGKVDSETYPVSDEVSQQWYVGLANQGTERWAFAFSAKRTWSEKVRKDVRGIIETNRGYSRILFFTNQNPRAADRLRVEDELSRANNVQVTIFDRNWIEEKTINNDNLDLAFDILGVGDYDPKQVRRGVEDTRRERELAEIEDALADSKTTDTNSVEAVSLSLLAAKLSRGIEAPRDHTEGRFTRAKRLAAKHGTDRQQIAALYEHAWTTVWWFDDIPYANELYSELETLVDKSGYAGDQEKLSNLLSVFFGQIANGNFQASVLKFQERSERLKQRLETLAADANQPSNALYAETLLAMAALRTLPFSPNPNLTQMWVKLSAIIDKAEGLGEFPAELVDKLVQTISEFAPDNSAFDELIEKLADFMGRRHFDGKQGELFLHQGKRKLKAELPSQAIAWIGKAALCFAKKEFEHEQVEALYSLAVAYRGIGLYWAARSCALSCLVVLQNISADENEFDRRTIPATKLLALVCLQAGHLPDALLSMFMLQIYRTRLSLSAEMNERLQSELDELDTYLACWVSVLPKQVLSTFGKLPSILDELDLNASQSCLLYRLGYGPELKALGFFPDEATDEEIKNVFEGLARQPAASDLPRRVVANQLNLCTFFTTILGVSVEIEASAESALITIGELLAASIEAFSATLLNYRAFPLTDKAVIKVRFGGDEIEIKSAPYSHDLEFLWPHGLDPLDPTVRGPLQRSVLELSATLTGMIVGFDDALAVINQLAEDEKVFDRTLTFSMSTNAHGRVFGKGFSTVDDIPITVEKSYPEKPDAPELPARPSKLPGEDSSDDTIVVAHNNMRVHTVINMRAWNEAGWSGVGYAFLGDDIPPALGLLFSNEDAGRYIFEEFRRKFGHDDVDDIIRISFLTGVNKAQPLHYRVHISASRAALQETAKRGNSIASLSRHQLMQSTDLSNFQKFIDRATRFKSYLLVPFIRTADDIEPLFDLGIVKHRFNVVEAWRIGIEHEDAFAVQEDDDYLVPKGESSPPYLEVLKLKATLGSR